MKDYNLIDIHFHTDLSFDAFENDNGIEFNWIDFLEEEEKILDNEKKIKLIVKTDHNIFNYKRYDEDKKLLKEYQIKYLPGIELNGNSKVHWIIIFNDEDLTDKINGKEKGYLLDEAIQGFFEYETINPSMTETAAAQTVARDVGSFVNELNKLSIKFIAIPHLNKTGGWYDKIKLNKEELNIIKYYLSDNIISGFESKNNGEFISHNIKMTEMYIEKIIKDLYEEGGKYTKVDLERRKEHLKTLLDIDNIFQEFNPFFVYGSDYHGTFENQKVGLKGYANLKDKLSYMKSDLSFEGLRFALLDQQSRMYSKERYNMYKKNPESWIKKITYINSYGKETTLTFKDGLNTIIGSRGTGKSFFISAITDNLSSYENAPITNDIIIKEIELANGSKLNKLDEEMYDIVFQKRTETDNKVNNTKIHEILSKAPYNINFFVDKIRELYGSNENVLENKIIENYFEIINYIIMTKINLYNYLNTNKINYDFIKDYNNYTKEKAQTMILENGFKNFEAFLKTVYKDKINNNVKIDEILLTLENLQNQLINSDNIKEVKTAKTKNKNLNLFQDTIPEIIEDYQSIKITIEQNKTKISNVLSRVSSINLNLSTDLTNEDKGFNEKIKDLTFFIANTLKLMRICSEQERKFDSIKKSLLTDEEIFEFEVNKDKYRIKTVKEIDFQKINSTQLSEAFSNYNNNLSADISKSILLGSFDDKYIEELIKNKDRRNNDYKIKIPSLSKNIFISQNNAEYQSILLMSQGERSDILLQMVLDENTNKILILDQPEDDLDNETVFLTLIKKIRKLKLRRQIFVVTHNANVCISADSDTITVSENNGNRFKLFTNTMESSEKVSYKSINSELEGTQLDIAVNILEGGKRALRRRVKAIGYKSLFFKNDLEGEKNGNNI